MNKLIRNKLNQLMNDEDDYIVEELTENSFDECFDFGKIKTIFW